ncbi:thiamine-phosphate kinase [Humidesulfovibrio mexicanus]|uniref:Thiamine-monophosphate kinase n=1 Tax=Humidesulfovibrio mexicanus TaxID=147047 RepID=A0A239BL09_9BACT|nr:thiamine-phosphate kinase [Humidesulfovibrio mexicanus]SNS08058.1 thiamine-phosphate kinase [Humidesulfovibrio mexicanus]
MPTSEQDFLAVIDRHFPDRGEHVLLGRGDDCAIIGLDPGQPGGGRLCLSTDLFVENVHFRRSYFSPADIGHKALAAAASDLAGMGAAPVGFALSLALPEGLDDGFLDQLLAGMAELSGRLSLPLIGGDLSRGPVLALDVVVLGRPGPSGRLLKRGQARPGDALLLLGDIGLARAGLLELECRGECDPAAWPAARAAHLRPEPRIAEGLALAQIVTADGPAVSGLMDVSDGLTRDLPRFLGPYGADISLNGDQLHPEVAAYFSARGEDPVEAALLGGEDYALLASTSPERLPMVLAVLPQARVIGAVSSEPGVRLNSGALLRQGFDHFAGRETA